MVNLLQTVTNGRKNRVVLQVAFVLAKDERCMPRGRARLERAKEVPTPRYVCGVMMGKQRNCIVRGTLVVRVRPESIAKGVPKEKGADDAAKA